MLNSPWGETVLENRPERIAAVVTNGRDTELLAAIGVTPVLAPDTVERGIYTMNALPSTIETIYEYSYDVAYPLEVIAAAHPDLIIVIGDEDAGTFYEKLSEIAPVLTGSSVTEQVGRKWQADLKTIALALDLSDSAAAVIAGHEDRFSALRKEHPEFADKSVTFAVHYGGDTGTYYFSSAGSDAEAFFISLGFTPNPLAEQFIANGVVSPEMLGSLDADVVILVDHSDGHIADVTDSPLFRQLGAVKGGRLALVTNAHFVTGGNGYFYRGVEHEGNLAWALTGSGPLGQAWSAEQVIPILEDVIS